MEAETFKLAVGESCVVKQSYIDKLKNTDRYKIMYTRTALDVYVWLDNKGDQGTFGNCSGVHGVFHDTEFSSEHWEKLST